MKVECPSGDVGGGGVGGCRWCWWLSVVVGSVGSPIISSSSVRLHDPCTQREPNVSASLQTSRTPEVEEMFLFPIFFLLFASFSSGPPGMYFSQEIYMYIRSAFVQYYIRTEYIHTEDLIPRGEFACKKQQLSSISPFGSSPPPPLRFFQYPSLPPSLLRLISCLLSLQWKRWRTGKRPFAHTT